MVPQSEKSLEDQLIDQLQGMEYEYVTIKDEATLLANFKTQLEIHNNIHLSEGEFAKVLNHLNKGNIFERAKTLRDKMQLTRDDGSSVWLQFINQEHRCRNEYQVTHQVTQEGNYKNRYDVTILINGLPLVQIELKRRGLELKEAFNQINRYQRHSFDANYGLYQYVQIFVISNGVNTKYYANNRKQSFKQTFYRADKDNKKITQLQAFAREFLEPCHLSKMITKYVVMAETDKILMVLRPYQYYACEAIIDRIKNSEKNGYIWHTTGSGKTLTSFKVAQIATHLPEVAKVVFVVDRKDLDYQTTLEFNNYSKGSVDGTDNTKKLVQQFGDETKLIVTTIQKLNTAISKNHHLKKMEHHADKRVIFIFDECHRSQFGDTHKRIKSFFTNSQMFGFTGTPIFAENAVRNEHGKRTTAELFDECLHKYVITDAIRDENVLKFSIEYVGKYTNKHDDKNNIDIEVEEIDTKELLESEDRLNKISEYIIANHNRKTHSKEFTAIFCVSSIDVLTKYYDIFAKRKESGDHNLRIATIFSYQANEDDADANGFIPDESGIDESAPINKHSRDKLEAYIQDYNKMFSTNFTTKDSQSFYNYYNDIAKKVKDRKIDILLVVNMFLTGFDSKTLNTLYVDKNLRYHGLIQTFSRTNRIINEKKSQGNIVCFRNLKHATDEAITLFSNKDAKETILMGPYEQYVEQFNKALEGFFALVPEVDSVNKLSDEEQELAFVQQFRNLIRIKNVLEGFANFSYEDLGMNEQLFEDYKSKYLDLYDKVRTDTQTEKVSILDDVDFEIELIHRNEINVAYILHLLAKLYAKQNKGKTKEAEKEKEQIKKIVAGEHQLRSKKELIERFIEENMPHITDSDNIEQEFYKYWNEEKQKAFQKLCKEEGLIEQYVEKVIAQYLFTEKTPLRKDVVGMLSEKPKLLERGTIIERVTQKVLSFIEKYISGINTSL